MMDRKNRYVILAFLLLFISAFSVSAEVKKCERCNGTGKIASKQCPTPIPYICTYSYNEFKCHGWGWLVCPKCKGAQKEWAEREKEYREWLAKRREKIDRMVFFEDWEKYKIGHVEGEHFIICGTTKASVVYINNKPVKMNERERSHLFLRRAEKMYKEQFLPMMGLKAYEPEEKWEMTFWRTTKEVLQASNRLIGITQAGVSTAQARLITVEDTMDDKKCYQAVMFNLALLLVEEYEGFVDDALPDWFWEAFAHYVEFDIFGNVKNNCNDEALGTEGLKGKGFRRKLKQMVKKKKVPNIEQWGGLNVSRLSPDARMVGWSLIDWIIKDFGPKKLALFVRIVKRTKSQAIAFRDALGVKFTDVMSEWSKWVLKNY